MENQKDFWNTTNTIDSVEKIDVGRLVRIQSSLLNRHSRSKFYSPYSYEKRLEFFFAFIETEQYDGGLVGVTEAGATTQVVHDSKWTTKGKNPVQLLSFFKRNERPKIHVPVIACSPIEAQRMWANHPVLKEQIKSSDIPKRQMMYAPGLPNLKGQEVEETGTAWSDPIVQQNRDSFNAVELGRRDYGFMARPPKEGETPNLISSLAEGSEVGDPRGTHFPCLDIDFGAKLVPTQTKGHYHLYLNTPVAWGTYRRLLNSLAECGIIEDGFAHASIQKGFTSLRPPMSHVAELMAKRIKEGKDTSLESLQCELTSVGEDTAGKYHPHNNPIDLSSTDRYIW